jgi:hypothetical protein
MCLIFEDENKSSSDEKDNLQSTVHMIGSLSSKAARYMKRCCICACSMAYAASKVAEVSFTSVHGAFERPAKHMQGSHEEG